MKGVLRARNVGVCPREQGGTWLAGWLPVCEQKEKGQGSAVVVVAVPWRWWRCRGGGGGGRGRSGIRGVRPCVVKEYRGLAHLRGPSLPAFSCLWQLQALLENKRYSVVLGASGFQLYYFSNASQCPAVGFKARSLSE